jgi:PDZ domain
MTVRIGWVLALTLAALAGGFALAGVVDAPAGTAAGTGDALAQLRAELAFERGAREALASQVARLEADLAALRGPEPTEAALAAAGGEAPADAPPADDVAEAPAPSPDPAWFDGARLAKAGLSERDAADLKRIFEETELDRLYLRDQATREGWPDGRLAQELAQLDEKMTSVRDDYGEAAYDWFLYAAGRANRVKVEGVLGGSTGSEVGIQAGDHIYSYAGERIYKPWSLVQATQSGRPGETVEVEVERGGERLRVTVPRGPIGVRIGRDTVEPPLLD